MSRGSPRAQGVCFAYALDGIYAPVSVLNGIDAEITGRVSGFFTVRCLGGGAVGTQSNSTPPSDGYTKNWRGFITFSLEFQFRAVR